MDDDRFLISPPPGLLPPPRESMPESAPVTTGSETRRTGIIGVPVAPAPAPAAVPAPVIVPAAPAAPAGTVAPADEPGAWFIRLADGQEHELGPAGLVLGRNPAPPATLPDAIAVSIDDPGRSISKTHAALALDGDRVRVLDLHSTNGVAVTPARGDAAVVPEGGLLAEPGSIIALGEVTLGLDRR